MIQSIQTFNSPCKDLGNSFEAGSRKLEPGYSTLIFRPSAVVIANLRFVNIRDENPKYFYIKPKNFFFLLTTHGYDYR